MTERMPQAADREASAFAFDSALCSRCSGVLMRHHFATDVYGQTVEDCPKCGPQLLAMRRGSPVVAARNGNRVHQGPSKGKPCDPCICGKPILWTRGVKPKGCVECRKKWRYETNVRYNIEKYARRREAKRLRKTA